MSTRSSLVNLPRGSSKKRGYRGGRGASIYQNFLQWTGVPSGLGGFTKARKKGIREEKRDLNTGKSPSERTGRRDAGGTVQRGIGGKRREDDLSRKKSTMVHDEGARFKGGEKAKEGNTLARRKKQPPQIEGNSLIGRGSRRAPQQKERLTGRGRVKGGVRRERKKTPRGRREVSVSRRKKDPIQARPLGVRGGRFYACVCLHQQYKMKKEKTRQPWGGKKEVYEEEGRKHKKLQVPSGKRSKIFDPSLGGNEEGGLRGVKGQLYGKAHTDEGRRTQKRPERRAQYYLRGHLNPYRTSGRKMQNRSTDQGKKEHYVLSGGTYQTRAK